MLILTYCLAILSGDAAAITAYKYIETCEDRYLRQVIDGFNQVAMDVCKGQQYQDCSRALSSSPASSRALIRR